MRPVDSIALEWDGSLATTLGRGRLVGRGRRQSFSRPVFSGLSAPGNQPLQPSRFNLRTPVDRLCLWTSGRRNDPEKGIVSLVKVP